MLSFILIAVLITLLTLVLLVRPLLKTRSSFSYERQAQNIHFAKERLQELEQQLNNASISAADYEALKLEIESTLALDIDLTEEAQKPSEPAIDGRNRLLIGLLCIVVPLASLAIYNITGTPAVLSAQTTGVAPQAGGNAQTADVESMLSALEDKLEENPNDIQGWAMLARSYYALGRYRDAIKANAKLLELGGDNPDVYAAMADSSALLAKGVLAGQPSLYIEKALALQDDHPQALWLAGLAAAQTSNGDLARQYWNKLLPLLDGALAQQQELQTIIDQSFNFSDPASSPEKTATPTDNNNNDAASVALEGTAGPSLSIRVSIDDALNSQVTTSDVVFVFARAKQGPPAPLAVRRLTVADLPANITLSDSDAMMDQFKLSRFDEVLVSARVAKSGNPIAQAGDFQSVLFETQTSNAGLIDLTISKLVE
ncbi:MAG: cytochrome c-type biogenesis protein CcmH [Polaribacter sp.]|jgi:cytochrome c-type biogenesis protein CcmH